MKTRLLPFALALFALNSALPSKSQAAFAFLVAEVGPDVVVTGSGTLNTSALTLQGNTTGGSGSVYPVGAGLFGGTPSNINVPVSFYGGSTFAGPNNFGTTIGTSTTLGSGDAAGIFGSALLIRVPQGYVSGTPLSNTNTFANASFASLGILPGTYTWTWGTGANADFLTVNAVVPEPSTWALLGVGAALAMGGLVRRGIRS